MKNKLLQLILFLVAGFCVLFLTFPTQPLFLIAKGTVPVFETKQDAMRLPKEKALTNLKPQQKVNVVSCIDAKHYLIYEIRFEDGRTGFVNEGDYIIQKNGKPSGC